MKALIFPDSASCDAFAAKVDAELGYPKPGTDIGDGIHVPPAQSVTLRWAAPIEHPIQKGTFAYPVEGIDNAKLSKTESDAVVIAATLTSDWAKPDGNVVQAAEVDDAKP